MPGLKNTKPTKGAQAGGIHLNVAPGGLAQLLPTRARSLETLGRRDRPGLKAGAECQ
jgi:hypothetical protein